MSTPDVNKIPPGSNGGEGGNDTTPELNPDGTPKEHAGGSPAPTGSEPGSQTPPELLLKSLKEERAEKAELKKTISNLQTELTALKQGGENTGNQDVKQLQEQINGLTETLALKDLVETQPLLKGHETEFKEFQKLYPGVDMAAAAKLFISEKGLAPNTQRKGLEPLGGGHRQPPKEGLSPEEITNLRTTNYRLYSKLVREGKIKV